MEDNGPEKLTPDEQVAARLEETKEAFPVVGLGGSAGSLKALTTFFSNVPESSGIAYVVILHLSPDFESNLAQIIQRETAMPVTQVNETVLIEPDRVYVIPPNKFLSMADGAITVSEPERTKGRRVPIDIFFRTLAESRGPFAGAVVLSGSGSDGTIGLARIKEYTGVVIAQDPGDAEYAEMPRSAINTGLVDYILPATRMPAQLISYWDAADKIQLPPPEEPKQTATGPSAEEALRSVIGLLRLRTGHDYSEYKRSTVLRRVARRMQVNDTETVADYLEYVRSHTNELDALEGDLLISVTNFFRDTQAFTSLEQDIIPQLFDSKYSSDVIRVWVAGCATGEEAYSLAMQLSEHADKLAHPPSIQIFATDLDDEAINIARSATYPESIVADVTPDRLGRFFTKEQSTYRVKKEIREMVLFAVHNVLKDPPFSRLDLISCRNLLIYLTRAAQNQVLETFHFALKPNGYLFLGTSETVDGMPTLFLPINTHEHIFERLNVANVGQFATTVRLPQADGSSDNGGRRAVMAQKTPSLADMHRTLAEQFGPPSVLIDRGNDIVHVSHNGARFLQFVPGEPSNNLLKVALPELRLDLRAALYTSEQSTEPLTRRVRLNLDGRPHDINLTVVPVQGPEAVRGLKLVIFDDIGEVPVAAFDTAEVESHVVHELEEELRRTKEQLRVLIEQYETSTEELKASNEELQAINEELRSTTEELETSKEELQAVNEEMQTVNQELKHKVDEVSWANNDLQNLLSSTDIATMFVDRDLQIKRFTPQIQELFNIIPADLNRPLSHVTHKLIYDTLVEDAEFVLQKLVSREREVETTDSRWFLARLLPYRTVDEKIDGVVLTFIDITERERIHKEREILIRQLEDERARFEALVEQIPGALTVAEAPSGKLIYVSKPAVSLWGGKIRSVGSVAEYSTILKGCYPNGTEYKPEDWPLARAVQRNQEVSNEEITLVLDNGEQRNVLASALPVRDRDGKAILGVALWADITQQKRTEEQLRRSTAELERQTRERGRELQELTGRLSMERANENVRLELMRQLVTAQEEERRRIAGELHDELGQLLTALKFLLDTAARQSDSRNDQVDEARSIVDTVVARVRELSANLRPSVLDDAGLLPALLSLVDRFTNQTGVKVTFKHEGLERRFSPDVETTIYRLVQEALTNVAKHANVHAASVSILVDSSIIVQVEDKGSGFDTTQVGRGLSGNGLPGMGERIRMVGGELTIESKPGDGTRIIAEVPLPSEPPPARRGKRTKTEG